ncbi:hypothetical protein BSTEL_2178, partial [Bifidobacterium stellenboschense]
AAPSPSEPAGGAGSAVPPQGPAATAMEPAPQQPTVVNVVQAPLARQLKTKRSLLKYILLGIVTFGIYDIWQMSEIGETLNLIASRRDGKRTMHYCLMFFLVGGITLGIGWFVWYHRMSSRIGDEQQARGMQPTVTAATYWLWGVLGILLCGVGPFIYMYKLLHAMNDLCADYNQRGI